MLNVVGWSVDMRTNDGVKQSEDENLTELGGERGKRRTVDRDKNRFCVLCSFVRCVCVA